MDQKYTLVEVISESKCLKKSKEKQCFEVENFENQRSQLKNIPLRLVNRLFSVLIHYKIVEILQQLTHVEQFLLDISFRPKHKPDDHRVHNQIIVKHRRFRPRNKSKTSFFFLSLTVTKIDFC